LENIFGEHLSTSCNRALTTAD